MSLSLGSTFITTVQKIKSFILANRYVLMTLVIIVVCVSAFLFFNSRPTKNSPWTQTQAAYLAGRVLLDPTPADVAKLTAAGSVVNAVNILFTAPSAAQEQAYQTGLTTLTSQLSVAAESAKNNTGITDRNMLYAYQLIHDPNDAQRKLYYLMENIFSVDSQGADPGDIFDKISDQDVNSLDQILYQNAYGNYPSLVQKVQTTYAMSKYLDLVNSSEKSPNENYSREMMQLFMMGQYTPLDTKLTTENYTDQDVNDLAYLLTGYKRTGGDITEKSSLKTVTNSANSANSIYFDPKAQYQGTKLFLGNQVSFPDPTDAITYIVQQRPTEVSEFLSDKILKYYVSDNPSPEDIVTFAGIITQNNFDILPSLKWLFTSDIMYRPQYMQEERYKSPVELVSSYYTDLYGRDNYSIVPTAQTLTDLGFAPLLPGSIFGRPGFNSNILFYSGTILDKWIGDTDSTLLAKNTSTATKQFLSGVISNNAITTPVALVQCLEKAFYGGAMLPGKTEDDIVMYVTDNGAVSSTQALDTTNPTSLNRMLGMLDLLFAQPEFILTGGNPSAAMSPKPLQQSSSTIDPSTLVIVRLRGGLDYQQLVANTADPAYAANRKSLALTGDDSLSLGNGYMLNSAAQTLMPLIQSKQASLITGVGLPGQIRAHDIASEQMETGLNVNGTGIAAALENAVPSLNLVSLTNSPPIMYKGAPSLQMGSSNLALFPELGKNNTDPSGQLSAFEKILQDRLLPQKSALYYSQVLLLNQLAEEDIASGGKGTPGPTNSTQFPFLESLMSKHIGNVYYLYADDSYDFHYNEDPEFNEHIEDLTKQVADFYNAESKTTKLTVVLFSEFGRTDKINGNDGTDHGTGGGMTVISNVLHLPTMIGTLSPSTDPNNWSTVVVDERDVWDTIFNSLYSIPVTALFGRTQTIGSYPVTIQ
jgi:uncharacterized protein (DUF1800 family)